MDRRLVTALFAAALAAPPLGAQQPRTSPPRAAAPNAPPSVDSAAIIRHLTMTVSGGVSLGSYQAGATWALIYTLRNREALEAARQRAVAGGRSIPAARPYLLDVLTGASAGNINALLAGIEYCSAAAPTVPEQSLLWLAWHPIGFDNLAPRGRGGEPGVLSRKAFGAIWKTLDTVLVRRPRRPDCDLLLGITATKLTPLTFDAGNGFEVPIQRFAGVFRLVADTNRLAFTEPRLEDVASLDPSDVLILDPGMESPARRVPRRLSRGDVVIDSIRQLAEGSSSFPVAFAPRVIAYQRLSTLAWGAGGTATPPCLADGKKPGYCADARHERFVDGGVLDNRPLGLALELSRAVDRVDQRAQGTAAGQQRMRAAAADAAARCRAAAPGGAPAAPAGDSLSGAYDALARIDSALAARPPADSSADTVAVRLRGARAAVTAQIARLLDAVRSQAREADQASATYADCAAATARLHAITDSLERAASEQLGARVIYFINNDSYRPDTSQQDTDSPDAAAAAAEPRGGIAAALKTVGGAFDTGQNAEARAFLSRISLEQRAGYPVSFRRSNRWPALMGEHITHFGAFIAPTFREHDFYAGVYDGLRSAFRELYCAPRAAANPSPRGTCESAWMHLVVGDKLIAMRPEGQAVVAQLLTAEESPGLIIHARSDSPKTFALTSLVEVNLKPREYAVAGCETYALLVESPLCSEGLANTLTDWRRVFDRSSFGEAALCTGANRDRVACDFMRDPYAVYHGMLLRILLRMRNTEAYLGRQKHPRQASFRTLLDLPLLVERAYVEQYRSCDRFRVLPCLDVNPTSSDILGGVWYNGVAHLLPSSLGMTWHGDVRWAEWRPSWYATSVARTAVILSAPIEAMRVDGQARGAVGGAFTLMPSMPIVTSLSYARLGQRGGPAFNDVTMALLAGIARVGMRTTGNPLAGRPHDPVATIGIGDVNGVSTRLVSGIGGGLITLARMGACKVTIKAACDK